MDRALNNNNNNKNVKKKEISIPKRRSSCKVLCERNVQMAE